MLASQSRPCQIAAVDKAISRSKGFGSSVSFQSGIAECAVTAVLGLASEFSDDPPLALVTAGLRNRWVLPLRSASSPAPRKSPPTPSGLHRTSGRHADARRCRPRPSTKQPVAESESLLSTLLSSA